MSEQNSNPSNIAPKKMEARERIPMSLPVQKLAVPEIPGYHLHWMLGTQSRIAQALRAGYEFVQDDEVNLTNSLVAGAAEATGNTDLGTRVSASAGLALDARGAEQRLYLMKIRQEWWEADQKILEDKNEQIAATLRGGGDLQSNPNGGENRYIPEAHRKGVANLFTPKRRM